MLRRLNMMLAFLFVLFASILLKKNRPIPRQENIAKCSWRKRKRIHLVSVVLSASLIHQNARLNVTRQAGLTAAAWRIVTVLIFFRSPWGLWARSYYSAHTQKHLTPRVYSWAYIRLPPSLLLSYFCESVMPRERTEHITSDEKT